MSKLRARYAAIIRYSILAGRETRYGERDDPYYRLRSDIIHRYPSADRELGLRAFKRSWESTCLARGADWTHKEHRDAEATFKRCYEIWMETRAQREMRLLREEVQGLRQQVYALRATSASDTRRTD